MIDLVEFFLSGLVALTSCAVGYTLGRYDGFAKASRLWQDKFIKRSVYPATSKYQFHDRVTKISGSSWTGRVCGFYSTALTPIGYCIESDTETGSVQVYPEKALKEAPDA